MGIFKSSVPGVVVLVLCALSFYVGRFVQQSSSLPEPVSELQSSSRRALTAGKALVLERPQSTALATLPAPINPLDPTELERYMLEESGLLKILSWYPRLVVFPSFIDKARCEHIIKLAKTKLYPSGLAYRPGEAVSSEQETRTSKGTFLGSEDDPDGVLAWLEERIAAATLLPRENGEAFNVLEYQNMQHYDSHYDTFDPKDFGPQPSQRIATVLVYLSEVEEGGETVFKREGYNGGKKNIADWRNCNDGSFKYTPRLGDAVLFWGVTPDLEIDPHALHGGCPIKKGTKWVATKWIRNKGGRPYWA